MVRTKKTSFSEFIVIGLAVLIVIGLTLFNLEESRRTQRDLNRLGDLEKIKGALVVYHGKHGRYPPSQNGLIWACGWQGEDVCQWNQSWEDEAYVYTQGLPIDPLVVKDEAWLGYWYEPVSAGQSFIVKAWLEDKGVAEIGESHLRCPGDWAANEYIICPNS